MKVDKRLFSLNFYFIFCAALLFTLIFSACSKKGGSNATHANTTAAWEKATKNLSEIEAFFYLNYTPQEPEPVQTIDTIAQTFSAAKKNTKTAVPALRALSDYKIKYSTERLPAGERPSTAQSSMAKMNTDAFTVADWGPQRELPAAVSQPSFYVVFSEPVKAVSALDKPADTSDYMSISPKIKGVFRWYGSRQLAFEASENIDPLQEYKILLKDTLVSLQGKKLEGEKVFKVKTEALKITDFRPAYTYSEKTKTWIDTGDVVPEGANEVLLTFNYPVRAESLAAFIFVQAPAKRTFKAVQKEANSILLTIDGKIDYDTDVFVGVKQPRGGGSPSEVKWHTLKPFLFVKDNTVSYYQSVYLFFSHDIDAATAAGNLSTQPPMTITEKNISVNGNGLVLRGLTAEINSTYTLKIGSGLKDIYGRSLKTPQEIRITVPEAASYVRFLDVGAKMLEAQFPHKFLFEYQNIFEPAAYSLAATDNPLNITWEANVDDNTAVNLDTKKRNERQFVEMDLDPFLKNGRGFVRFDAAMTVPSWYEDEMTERQNCTSIQITDLGATVRYGINKALVLVTSLATGKPIKGAFVALYNGELSVSEVKKAAFASAKTDSNGLAVLTYNAKKAADFFKSCSEAVFVEKDNDKVVFYPQGHDVWREGIYSVEDPENGIQDNARIFMFTDRGLYKPGETLSFRGIDREQFMGNLKPYQGDYTLIIEEHSWNAKPLCTLTGKTSSSGGFYGDFELPKDIEPGSYRILYRRDDKNNEGSENIYFTVAFFERLKFQASLSLPVLPVIAGEKATGTLSASYLGGGSLANVTYEGSWFKEPYQFTSTDPAFKNYSFGPAQMEWGFEHLSSFSGNLSADGKVNLSCTTLVESLEGMPYQYLAEASVTDISNQRITAKNTLLVHPAQYYIGLSEPAGKEGFAKAGKELTFSYRLASPEGSRLAGLDFVQDNIKAELIREDWHLVQQRGARGSIYSSYEKESISEYVSEQKAALEGTIKITPKNAGYHMLCLSGKDSSGRKVKTEYSFYVTGSGSVFWNRESPSSIRLTPDQAQYNSGGTAKILLESPLPSGDYIITVEREGIFTEEIRHLDSSAAVLEIPIAKNYVPVVYVSISSYSVRSGAPVHQYGEEDLDKPKSYFGVTRLFINPRIKAFSVNIASDKMSYRPGEEVSITLTASQGGKPLAGAELTLLAVDRGVLDLINYHVPNPIDFFYNPNSFPLCVRGGDSRLMLMDPVTYEIKNLQGGDSDDSGKGDDEGPVREKIPERADFNPTAAFLPVLVTDAKGQVSAKFTLPDNLTTYRITAFGVQADLFALKESEIIAQNPINVSPVMPRRMRERDTVEAGVLLTNLDSKAHNITIEASLRAPSTQKIKDGILNPDGYAFIDGAAKRTVKLERGESVPVYFDIAAQKAGSLEAVFAVSSDVLSEKLIHELIIEKPYIFETFTACGSIAADEKTAKEAVIIPSFAEKGQGTLSLTLDSSRLGLLSEAVKYVFDYPYSCIEQQSSRVLPLIVFSSYIDVFGLDNRIKDTKKTVSSIFKTWKDVQRDDGGFPYWPDGQRSDFYVSLRIAHIYALAKARGYSNAEISFKGTALIEYIWNVLRNKRQLTYPYLRAYAAYVLTLAGESVPEYILGDLNLAKQTDTNILALCGMTYLLRNNSGDRALAQSCAAKIRSYLRPDTRGVDLSDAAPSSGFWYANDTTENFALIMQLFVQLDPSDEMVTKLLFTLLQKQRSGYWKNTVLTARVLDSVYTLIKFRDLDATDLQASAKIEKTDMILGNFKGAGTKPVSISVPFTEKPLASLKRDTALPLEFTKDGKGQLYYTASLSYALPEEMQEERDEGLEINCVITDSSTGKIVQSASGKSTLINLESGKIYKMDIRLSSGRDREFIALRAPVPSGGEIVDATFVTTALAADMVSDKEDEDNDSWWDYERSVSSQRIYDNEVQYFWNSFAKGSTTISFSFRAARRGVFPCPPLTAECMYEPEIFGRSSGYLFMIK